ncbi:MAG: ABC transporter ATP-binding protein/permease [Candidatus Saccharibacteria bacterium]|nr:ABC transporter ATP-binding protein/permease [Candidatus Saccharibacteria bacterium]
MLELKGVTKVYEDGNTRHRVLERISINFRRSEFVAILGPSGSGKTTLLNIIGGLDHYSSGDLRVNEVSTKKFKDKDWDSYRNHRIGFVFQSYNLIPHQTVLQNVKLALTLSGISKREANRRAKDALVKVGLKEHIYKRPNQLSGGQMQRVAIARALVNNPDIILADEPTGALDSETSLQIMELLKQVATDKLVIMVTHNPELAKEYATRIVTIQDGKITSDSKPYDGNEQTTLLEDDKKRKSRKTRMSFMTALALSLNNLLTKKWRTLLVAFAGSIGIIGIALILAISTGFQNYIDEIQADTLTSYPLKIQQESSNLVGTLLNTVMDTNSKPEGDKVYESKVISSMLGDITTNDIKKFRQYILNHYSEVKDDIDLMEDFYNVDPVIYTIDVSGALAKLNPNALFTAILGDSALISSYSSLVSAYSQYDYSSLEKNTKLLAGKLPENYDEVVICLPDANRISDLLTYSLGLHDTGELSKKITKVMSGESVSSSEPPLELTYEDLMAVDLRVINAAKTYRYNSTYNIYEDMSEDLDYMRKVYDEAERLKVVGIVTAKDDELTLASSGVLYLPSLTKHIIEEASQTEIVKKQLENPEIDVFTGKRFGEEQKYDFEFSDFVNIDQNKIKSAFSMTIDQNAVTAKTKEYMSEIANDITADISPVESVLAEKLEGLESGFREWIAEKMLEPDFDISKMEEYMVAYISAQDFSDLEEKFLIPVENFKEVYLGLLKLKISGEALVPDAGTIIETTLKTLSIKITELVMKSEILKEVGGLTAYLTSSFANAFSIDENALASAFQLKFTSEELARAVRTMFSKTEKTLASNLSLLNYQDLDNPTYLAFFFNSFEGKEKFLKFIDNYNELMRSYGQDNSVIEYSDTTGILMSSVKVIVDAVSYTLIAFVSISLVVSSIMIGIITYISVYERTKEIGILRAIGASKFNISNIFNAETFIVGLLSGLIGIAVTYLAIPIINLVLRSTMGEMGPTTVLTAKAAAILVGLSVILTLIGGLIPARAAAKKDPVEALRSE